MAGVGRVEKHVVGILPLMPRTDLCAVPAGYGDEALFRPLNQELAHVRVWDAVLMGELLVLVMQLVAPAGLREIRQEALFEVLVRVQDLPPITPIIRPYDHFWR